MSQILHPFDQRIRSTRQASAVLISIINFLGIHGQILVFLSKHTNEYRWHAQHLWPACCLTILFVWTEKSPLRFDGAFGCGGGGSGCSGCSGCSAALFSNRTALGLGDGCWDVILSDVDEKNYWKISQDPLLTCSPIFALLPQVSYDRALSSSCVLVLEGNCCRYVNCR